jgi:hypothetical protein
MGIGRMIERAGEAAGLPFPVHVHIQPDTHWRAAEWIPDASNISLGTPPSPTPCVTRQCRRSLSKISCADLNPQGTCRNAVAALIRHRIRYGH